MGGGLDDIRRVYVAQLAAGECPTSGKLRFPTEAAAASALEVARLAYVAGSKRRLEQRAYLCPECAAWHLTRLAVGY